MSLVVDSLTNPLNRWNEKNIQEPVTKLLGEAPEQIRHDRTHFPGSRPIQMVFIATLSSGHETPVLAEHCAENAVVHQESIIKSLRKSRHGQKTGLDGTAIIADEKTGLVLRRPGLDERLPGLRMLYDRSFARHIVTQLLERDMGPIDINLVAHRLGKRAVLRIDAADQTIFARVRAIKSADGAERYARHQSLWDARALCSHLQIPEPLGLLPELGLSLFSELPGEAPNFSLAHSGAIAAALADLQQLDLSGLLIHTGIEEARLLHDWLMRCRRYRPTFASELEAGVKKVTKVLSGRESVFRPCHRDLHEKQILMANGVVGLLDFDTLSLADPALDAGNLLAHLYLAGVDEGPLRDAIDVPDVGLWRQAALYRLAMIYAFSSTSDATLNGLIQEAARDARD